MPSENSGPPVDYLRTQQRKYEEQVRDNLNQANACSAEIDKQILLAASVLLGLIAGFMFNRPSIVLPRVLAVAGVISLGLIVASIALGMAYLWAGSMGFRLYAEACKRIADWIREPGVATGELDRVVNNETGRLPKNSGTVLLGFQLWTFGLGSLLYAVVASIGLLMRR
jgi:hypothetical protein